jgi:hypothetical protein
MNFMGFEKNISGVKFEILTELVMKSITLDTCFHADVFRSLYDPEDGGDFPPKCR